MGGGGGGSQEFFFLTVGSLFPPSVFESLVIPSFFSFS